MSIAKAPTNRNARRRSKAHGPRARSGSILILVVAVLMLLMLIGVAYLSSTQTEQYTARQHTDNTQADLIVQGAANALQNMIARGAYGPTPDGPQYRPALQEMVVAPAVPVVAEGAYNPYTSPTTDLWLGDRVPIATVPANGSYPATWSHISWPLGRNASGGYSFDSPFDGTIQTYAGSNKGSVVAYPTFRVINGVTYPALLLFANTQFQVPSPGTPTGTTSATGFITSTGVSLANNTPIVAADADGDGIADSMLVKVAEHDGITYYVATRVVDGNSAINASTAWQRENDPRAPVTAGVPNRNFGFFRSNVGLFELLGTSATTEMAALNADRMPNIDTIAPPVPRSVTVTSPVDPSYPANYGWWSAGDALEHLLAARPGNAGYGKWLGIDETLRLASRFSIYDNQLPASKLEAYLTEEMTGPKVPKQPFSANQVAGWFDQFNYPYPLPTPGTTPGMPLRAILVGHNAVSNTVPSRYGFTLGSSTDWSSTQPYHTGDWVRGSDKRSYVCLADHPGGPTAVNPATVPGAAGYDNARQYWAALPAVAAANTGTAPANYKPGMSWTSVPTKISINTAPFEALFVGAWNMMADTPAVQAMSTVPPTTYQAARPPLNPNGQTIDGTMQMPQFRNVIRDPLALAGPGPVTKRLTASQMLKLRAALFAVQAENLRSGNDDVIGHRVILDADTSEGGGGSPAYDAEVFGTKRQPFITEMVAQSDTIDPSNNYIALELSNPYPTQIDLKNWVLCTVDRSAMSGTGLTLTPITPDSGPLPIIPAATSTGPGIIVIASKLKPPTPPSNAITPPGTPVVMTNLYSAVGKELVLMRPRRADGNLSTSTDPIDPFTEDNLASPSDMVPADQLDLTGMDKVGDSRFHYRRASSHTSIPDVSPRWDWNLVFPGDYDLSGAAFNPNLRMPIVVETAPNTRTGGNLGIADDGTSQAFSAGSYGTPAADPPTATYDTVPLQLALANAAGGNPVQAANNMYPFGAFARNGDMLQVPFIGSYRITPHNSAPVVQPTYFTEMNSVTMDAALARDTTLPPAYQPKGTDTTATPFTEQIGRCCPVGDTTKTNVDELLDFQDAIPLRWHYHWGKRIFDYFTVQSPQDDYDPNYNPAQVNTYITAVGQPTVTPGTPLYPGGLAPQPVVNTASKTTDGLSNPIANTKYASYSEDTAGNEGLVNINTAPYPVLAMLPFNANKDVINFLSTQSYTNEYLAAAIVRYRTTNGPFRTLFDLYKVPEFKAANDAMLTPPPGATPPLPYLPHYDPGPAAGDFSPAGMGVADFPLGFGTDNVAYDFKERFLLLNHVSNLITTRSDTFTAYVLVQGFRGVDTGNPVKVEERRAAFLIDRNNVTPSNSKPVVTRVPQ